MDKVERAKRSEIMRAIKSCNTGLEMLVRRLLHKQGFRYRLYRKDLPGNPDLVFPSKKKVIFINGCFWHQHPDPNCRIAHRPGSNTDYWSPKLERTLARDAKNTEALSQLGWQSYVVWECQTKDQDKLLSELISFLVS